MKEISFDIQRKDIKQLASSGKDNGEWICQTSYHVWDRQFDPRQLFYTHLLLLQAEFYISEEKIRMYQPEEEDFWHK